MKLEEIRKVARENEIVSYIKSLYYHNIKILESIPEDRIKNIFKPRINSDSYCGLICALRFYEKGNFTSIYGEVIYADAKVDFEDISDEPYHFDNQGLEMVLYFDDREGTVEFQASSIFQLDNYFELEEKHNPLFLNSLTDINFLKVIFGKYLVDNCGVKDKEVCFRVSTQWFEN